MNGKGEFRWRWGGEAVWLAGVSGALITRLGEGTLVWNVRFTCNVGAPSTVRTPNHIFKKVLENYLEEPITQG